MADNQEKQSPLDIEGQKNRAALMPKNKYNDKTTAPIDEAGANKDPNAIGEQGTKLDKEARQNNLKFNKYNEKNKYPDF